MNYIEFSGLINKSEQTLDLIHKIEIPDAQNLYDSLLPVFKSFKDGGLKLLENDQTLNIGIVGQVKAGKSSFLNSLFFDGENILPRASTPMTAGLTVMKYAEKNTFEVEYFSDEDWNVFVKQNDAYKRAEIECRENDPDAPDSIIRKMIEDKTTEEQRSAHEMVSSCSSSAKTKIGSPNESFDFENIGDLQDILEKYVGAKGEFTSVVKALYVNMNDKRLQGIQIVDTPGVNDPVISREERTKSFLHSCHGVFLLSSSSDFLNSGDISFLNNRIGSQGVRCVLLLASKFDSVLQDLGAECVMKNLEPQDLVEAKDNQMRKFKKRLRDQQETIKGDFDIKLDFTAGIGYSIAHKSSNRWDGIEKNVVEQMKRFYPDYFSSEEDVKETFEGLANISDIRENYLENWFIQNKDSIISEKINEYFLKNESQIVEVVNKKVGEVEEKQNLLNKTTSEEIQRQRDVQGVIFDQLKNSFNSIFTKFQTSLQSNLRSIENNISSPSLFEIPTETTSGSFEYQGMIWGHNNDVFEYKTVSSITLRSALLKNINDYADTLNEKWRNLFKKQREQMQDQLYELIFEFEKSMGASSVFKEKYYRNLIDSTIDKMNLQNELQIKPVKDRANKNINEICSRRFNPDGCAYNVGKSQVPTAIRKAYESFEDDLRIVIDSFLSRYTQEVSQCIDDNMKLVSASIDDLKRSFAPQLESEGKKYMDELEAQMRDKRKSLEDMANVVALAQQLKSLF